VRANITKPSTQVRRNTIPPKVPRDLQPGAGLIKPKTFEILASLGLTFPNVLTEPLYLDIPHAVYSPEATKKIILPRKSPKGRKKARGPLSFAELRALKELSNLEKAPWPAEPEKEFLGCMNRLLTGRGYTWWCTREATTRKYRWGYSEAFQFSTKNQQQAELEVKPWDVPIMDDVVVARPKANPMPRDPVVLPGRVKEVEHKEEVVVKEVEPEGMVTVTVEELTQKLKRIDVSPRNHSNPWTGEGRDCYEPSQSTGFKMPQVG
jgi:hypothetical protein